MKPSHTQPSPGLSHHLSAHPAPAPDGLPLPSRRHWLGRFGSLTGLGLIGQAAGLLSLSACASDARAYLPPAPATLDIVDRETGQVLPVYGHDGRQFVPGRPGARYALRLRNRSSGRVLVVLAMDGINVISGETAAWHQTGYVLEPGRPYDITGWRKSGTEVAAFEFAPQQHSYAALTGRPGNVGVIGMAVFRERVQPPPEPPISWRTPQQSGAAGMPSPAAPAPSLRSEAGSATRQAESARDSAGEAKAAAPAAPQGAEIRELSRRADADAAGAKLGTGHGAREWSVSRRTAFERATAQPAWVEQIEYDSLERLVAAGIVPPTSHAWSRPRPFPANPGYVPDPPQR